MSIRTDQVNLIINVNGSKAQNELNELRKRAADLTFEMRNNLVKGTKEYVAAAGELKKVNADMAGLKKEIGLASLSMRELNAERRKLTSIRDSVGPETAAWKEYNAELQSVIARQNEVKEQGRGMAGFASNITSELTKGLGGLAAGYLGFQFVSTQIKNIVSGSAKLSDSLADIRRVSGMSANEVNRLNESLSNLDTRTSMEGLREIAVIAGKLGVAKEDIASFTQAVDMMVVTLGDELGDADAITTTLGKILNVFDGEVTGEGITKLGNTFVELANSGVATGGWMADFVQRLSGIAKSSGITLGALTGLGAGLEELGGRVESSATAIQKLLINIADDLPKAAAIAGETAAEFEKLYKADPQEALLRYAEGLTKNKESFGEIVASFKDAGEEGARVIETLSKMGVSADLLRDKIQLGSDSIKRTSAIYDGFALKNETLGATLEKLGKQFKLLFVNFGLMNFIKTALDGFSKLLSMFEKSKVAVDEYRESAEKLKNLENTVNPLIERIEELKNKTELSKEEQVELNKAIQELGNSIPAAITQFDAYGRAIGVSTEKAREYIALQQAILKEKNRPAIREAQGSLSELEKELKMQQYYLDRSKTKLDEYSTSFAKMKQAGLTPSKQGTEAMETFNSSVTTVSAKIQELQERIKGTKGILDELTGDGLKKSIDKLQGTPINPGDDQKGTVAKRKAELEKLIKNTEAAYQALNATDKKGQAANLALQRKYKAELDALMGVESKKGRSAAGPKNTEFDRLKKEAEKFYADLQKLKRDAENASLSGDERELLALQDKYDELHKKALEYFQKNATSRKQYTEQEKLIVEAFNKELADLQKKQFGKASEEEYAKSLEATKGYFDAERLQAGKNYADLLLTKEDYEAELLRLDQSEKDQMIVVAEGYVGNVKKAEADLLKFIIDADKAKTENNIKETEKRTAFALKEAIAKKTLAVLATPEGSKKRVGAEKDLLKEEFEQETAGMDKNSEQYKEKYAEFLRKLAALDLSYIEAKIDQYKGYADQLMSMTSNLFQALDNLDARRFNKEKALNDAKKGNYKKQLDDKLISQKQYEAKVAQADEELDRKRKEMEMKQFKRKQALAIAEALINGSVAITKTFVQYGWPAGIPFAAAMAIATGLQVSAIATQAPPEMGEGGLIKNGPYHKDKSRGLPVINPETGKTELLLERDEGVIKGKAMRDQKKYSLTGTPSQIASKLNSMHGGVNWESGAVAQMVNIPRPQLNPDLPRIMEQGGIIIPMRNAPEPNQETLNLILRAQQKMVEAQKELIEETKRQKERLHAVVSIKEFRATERKYDNAKRMGGMDQ